ncbi:hypothetical protein EPI10_001179 [Gossypium australe]|uniref:Uncharacterized protein n=1 Tax=Gossypium australe TaxID=47621 RepID=A0A5B6VA46_9ROSI|nr:hypothetical protein EPI10_001179 [Gossypium australe]
MGKETLKDAEITKVSFPSRLEERKKWDENELEMMEKHKKIKVGEHVNLSASCSVIISRKVPQKLKDSGSLTIPIEIGVFTLIEPM